MADNEIMTEPARTPYGARVNFLLGDDVDFALVEEECTLFEDATSLVRLRLARRQPLGRFASFKRFTAEGIGFASAGDAEKYGFRLALALLWAAVARRFTLHLDYHTVTPVTVFDRTASRGLVLEGHASVVARGSGWTL